MIEKPLSKTVRMFVLTVCIILSFNCRIPNASLQSFTGETIAFRWENLRVTETEFITEDDSISIIRNNNHTIYRLPTYHTETITNLNKNGDIINEEFKSTLNFQYFIHKNNENYGSMYDSINATNYRKRMLVDSFLIKHAFKSSTFDKLDDWEKISTFKEHDYIKETYTPVSKRQNQADTIYLSFSKKLKDLKYSFSFKQDSSKDSKLFRIKYVFNAIPPETGEIFIPRKEYYFELKRANINDQTSIRELIKVNDLLLNSKK